MKTFKEYINEGKNTRSKYFEEKEKACSDLKEYIIKNGWKLKNTTKSEVVGGGNMVISYWENKKINDTAYIDIYNYDYGDFNVEFSSSEPWYNEVTHRMNRFNSKDLLDMYNNFIEVISK